MGHKYFLFIVSYAARVYIENIMLEANHKNEAKMVTFPFFGVDVNILWKVGKFDI